MNNIEFFGYLAATLTTIAFIPQAWKTIKTKRTKDISIYMYILLNVGIMCWLVYGVMIESKPIMWANSITLLFTLPVLVIKIKAIKSGKE
jgi:MtN3 and saliva related transmembrane protein